MAEYIQVSGKCDIYIGDSDYEGTPVLTKLGEQLDDTRIEIQQYFHDVPGDRHGGPQGPPIERQILGKVARCVLNLSRFDPALYLQLLQHRAFADNGEIADAEVGSLVLLERAFRLLIKPAKNNALAANHPTYPNVDPFIWNFTCCNISVPISMNQGTKFSALQLVMEAHRAPEGHNKAGILWDRDTTGIPT